MAFIGASVRSIAQSAAACGFIPTAVDLFGDIDTVECCETVVSVQHADYPAGLYERLYTFPSSPWCYTGGLENYPTLLTACQQWGPLWGTPPESLPLCRDVSLWRDWSGPTDCLLPCVWLPGEPRPPWVDRHVVIKKKLASGGGLGVRYWDGQPPQLGEIIQQLVEGESWSAAFIGYRSSTVLLGLSRQLLLGSSEVDTPWMYLGSLGPSWPDSLVTDRICQFARMLCREAQIVGVFGLDFIVDADGSVWPIECNPRWTASIELYERSYRQRFFTQHVKACLGGEAELVRSLSPTDCWAKSYIVTRRSGAVTSISADCRQLALMVPHHLSHLFDLSRIELADRPQPGTYFLTDEVVATVLVPVRNLIDPNATMQGIRQLADVLADVLIK